MKDPEIAELEATARRKPAPVVDKPCKYCGTPIHWEKVHEGEPEERALPYEESGERHICAEYAAAKHSGKLLRDKAAALLKVLLDMYPDLLDDLEQPVRLTTNAYPRH